MHARIVVLLLSLLASLESVLEMTPTARADDAFRFLGIPIVGKIGADQTPDGVAASIALARDQGLDGLLLEIDARTGDLDDGVAIAGLIAAAAEDLRTIAVVRRAGGPALPILFACEDWIVLDQTPIEAMDERGNRFEKMLDADRVAIQALPSRRATLDDIDAMLAANRAACLRHLPASLAPDDRRGRQVLAEVLSTPGRDLEVAGGDGATSTKITAVPARRPVPGADAVITVPVADLGPGISAAQLSMTGLARLAPEGLEPLAAALGTPAVESFGDVGAALVTSAADDRASARARLGSWIDSMFSSLEGASQLTRALPWTLARARLSDPTETRRAGRLPMILVDGEWRIAPEAMPLWTRMCDDSIRRWRGVAELVDSVDELIDRAASLRGEIVAVEADPADRQRRDEALRIASDALDRARAERVGFDALAAEATARVATLERWRETPPPIQASPAGSDR